MSGAPFSFLRSLLKERASYVTLENTHHLLILLSTRPLSSKFAATRRGHLLLSGDIDKAQSMMKVAKAGVERRGRWGCWISHPLELRRPRQFSAGVRQLAIHFSPETTCFCQESTFVDILHDGKGVQAAAGLARIFKGGECVIFIPLVVATSLPERTAAYTSSRGPCLDSSASMHKQFQHNNLLIQRLLSTSIAGYQPPPSTRAALLKEFFPDAVCLRTKLCDATFARQ
ncbi:uncharacterized protein EV420DRAFT_1691562 [Desarmillaria tabescens]|uniref:Uncharacterized protein n=1 Tax=Armillaria tabescens TaxID=1929756 RepID=A0AA39K9U7_ARMTA|nr:uncharacterized protein EV420DRAFT_1691562 [Desarmillaria tabescens]KAK0457150.1 hypothetical protein EV420DRAFT_1691562 [Desarmillaria tabescens]